MCIQAIQNGWQDVWTKAEPYVVPVAFAGGVALLVNLVWGNIASACFVVVAGSVGLKYPSLIKVIAEDNFLMSLARLVLMAVLPFFGTLGILGMVTMSAASTLVKDFRLYVCRERLELAEAKITATNTRRQEQITSTAAMIVEYRANEAMMNDKLKELQASQGVVDRAGSLLAELKEKRDDLETKLNDKSIESQEVRKIAADMKDQITKLEENFATMNANYQALQARVDDLIKQKKGE